MTIPTHALRLDRIGLNVADLPAATRFYTEALGFEAVSAPEYDTALSRLLGARMSRVSTLRRGRQRLELTACEPLGAPYPPGGRSDDLMFQHCALVTDDMHAAYGRLARFPYMPISRDGPRTLPGGVIAYKFRDPEGHPLELIQFPGLAPRALQGIDHSAISVANVEKSIAFYTTQLGLVMYARQINTGPAQDALDDLDDVVVDVVSLGPKIQTPHVELLGYRTGGARASHAPKLTDIAATRLAFSMTAPCPDSMTTTENNCHPRILHDPDGHILILDSH